MKPFDLSRRKATGSLACRSGPCHRQMLHLWCTSPLVLRAIPRCERYFNYDPVRAEILFGSEPVTPAVNTGFTFARSPVYESLHLAPAGQRALADTHGYLTEQTIVACAALRSAGILWNKTTVYLEDKDSRTTRPTYRGQPWKARDYTGNVRHLFWRDAFVRRFDRN